MINQGLALMTAFTLLLWANAPSADDSGAIQPRSAGCANCHGVDKNNEALHGPDLVGQNSLYLIKQINSFRSGTRIHPLISANGLELNSREIKILANYYANLKPQNPVNKLSKDGELMYSPCSGCHGTQGEGVAPFPRLIGQKPAYLQQQLVNFKTGVRQNAVMQAMTINLSDEEINLLAAYLGSSKKPKGVLSGKIVLIDPDNEGR